MSTSGSKGFIGLATQGPSNADMTSTPTDAAYRYVEAIAAPFRPMDVSRTRLPTIGDTPLPRNAYKVGTSVQSTIALEATPNIMGKLLYLLMGKAEVANPIGWSGSGVNHRIRMEPTDQYRVPYFAMRRGVGSSILEEAFGCKIARGQLAFQAGAAAQASFDIQGRVPAELDEAPVAGVRTVRVLTFTNTAQGGAFKIVTPYGQTANISLNGAMPTATANAIRSALAALFSGAGVSLYAVSYENTGNEHAFAVAFDAFDNVGALSFADVALLDGSDDPIADAGEDVVELDGSAGINFDASPILTVVNEEATFEIETADGIYSDADDNVIALGVQIEWTNMLTSPQRYRIGSPYPIDYTLLDREAVVTVSLEIDDPTLYRKVYYAGKKWNPKPWVGGFRVKATSAEQELTGMNGSNLVPCSLEALANTLHFQTMLIANEPQKVVEATLTASLLKSRLNSVEAMQFNILSGQSVAFA